MLDSNCTEIVGTIQQTSEIFPESHSTLFGGQQSNADIVLVSESLVTQISNNALKQGQLQKRVLVKKKETWKEEYFMLDKFRLWFIAHKQWERDKQVSYIDLNEETKAVVDTASSFTFTISFHKGGRSPFVLRARDRHEMNEWIKAINERWESSMTDNERLAEIEHEMVACEEEESMTELAHLSQLSRFEGFLSTR